MFKKLLKVVAFVLIGAALLSALNGIVTNSGDYRMQQFFGNFYAEKPGSLDAVYIGSSSVYAFWLAPLAWERYGIAVHPLAANAMPFAAMEFMIKEARKTQPDALYIISLSANEDKLDEVRLHYLADNMPLSANKIEMVRTLGSHLGYGWSGQMEFLFPFIRFHSRWNELEERDFSNPLDGLKGSSYYKSFLRTSKDISGSFRTTQATAPLDDVSAGALERLLDYCDAQELNVLFVQSPRAIADEYRLAQVNTFKQVIESRGYPVLDLMGEVDAIGLDLTKDYYNNGHTNIHGAIKVTDYIARYLTARYGFADKRGDPAYASWDEAYEIYTETYAAPYCMEAEWQNAPRDPALAAPALAEPVVDGTTVTLSWQAVEGADGYCVYRKAALKNHWALIGSVGADTPYYADASRGPNKGSYYTVISYRERDGVTYWGDYDYVGVSAKTTLDAPVLQSAARGEDGVTVSWTGVEGAGGYAVFRRVPGGTWTELADVGAALTYTDGRLLDGAVYEYTVKAYADVDGKRVLGSFDDAGLRVDPE